MLKAGTGNEPPNLKNNQVWNPPGGFLTLVQKAIEFVFRSPARLLRPSFGPWTNSDDDEKKPTVIPTGRLVRFNGARGRAQMQFSHMRATDKK